MMRAKNFIVQKEWDNAIKDLEKVLEMIPHDVEANRTLIKILIDAGRKEEAAVSKRISIFLGLHGSSFPFWDPSKKMARELHPY